MEGPTNKCFEVLNKSFEGLAQTRQELVEKLKVGRPQDYSWVYQELGLTPEQCPLTKALNLYEHATSMQTLHSLFRGFIRQHYKPKWTRYWVVRQVCVNRIDFIELEFFLAPPINIKGPMPLSRVFRLKVFDYASREIHSFDLRKIPETRIKSWPFKDKYLIYIVLCPQVHPDIRQKLKRPDIAILTLEKAFKVEGRNVKWVRNKPREFEITSSKVEFGLAVLKIIERIFSKALEPLLQHIRKFYPTKAEAMDYWIPRLGILTWSWEFLDRPPPWKAEALGYVRGYRWTMR
jgi:hypothetical protein